MEIEIGIEIEFEIGIEIDIAVEIGIEIGIEFEIGTEIEIDSVSNSRRRRRENFLDYLGEGSGRGPKYLILPPRASRGQTSRN